MFVINIMILEYLAFQSERLFNLVKDVELVYLKITYSFQFTIVNDFSDLAIAFSSKFSSIGS